MNDKDIYKDFIDTASDIRGSIADLDKLVALLDQRIGFLPDKLHMTGALDDLKDDVVREIKSVNGSLSEKMDRLVAEIGEKIKAEHAEKKQDKTAIVLAKYDLKKAIWPAAFTAAGSAATILIKYFIGG